MDFFRVKGRSILAALLLFALTACTASPETETLDPPSNELAVSPIQVETAPSPEYPDLQAEILDERFRSNGSPLAAFDFTNHTYPLPRGWQNPDGSDIKLENGRVAPVAEHLGEEMSDEEKARRRAERRIGLSYVTTRFFDVTGDGIEEAIVILKIETGGSAIPQLVYVYEAKDGQPNLIWNFRTGDRSDGGLKDIRPELGQVVLELYGQDRFLLGEIETGKITGDEEQICCPTHFTRSIYEWDKGRFTRKGDRLTFQTATLVAPPLKNFGDIMNDPIKSKKYLDAKASPTPRTKK
jgi:hypothetical protein